MSIHTITLELPFGFVPDPILKTATPEQRAIVLTTGCVALKALLNKTDSLSYEEAYEKATAEQTSKWLAEKSQLEEAAKQEKEELLGQKSAEVNQLNNKLNAEQKKVTRQDEELTKTKTLLDLAETKANTLLKSQDETVREERNRTRAQVEEEKSKEIEKLNKEIEEKRVKLEKTEKALSEETKRATDVAIQAEKDKSAAVDKVREELTKQIKEQQDRVLSLTGRQSNSSLKGKDNENDFAQLLHDAFGLSPDYLKDDEHRIESGDHVIQWEGLKLMFENKKYKDKVPTKEVEKAIKDFEKHAECDVLIFVSETSSIAKHERPGHLDIDTINGRAAIWIGEFDSNENKVVYMQMIAQVIRQLARLQKRAKELGNGDDIVGDYKEKIITIRRYLQNTKEDLDSLVKAQNEYQRAQKSAWDALKERIRIFKDNFNRRLESATKDDDDDVDSSTANENKNVPGKKREAAAMKKPPRKRTHKQVDSAMNSTVMNTNPQ